MLICRARLSEHLWRHFCLLTSEEKTNGIIDICRFFAIISNPYITLQACHQKPNHLHSSSERCEKMFSSADSL